MEKCVDYLLSIYPFERRFYYVKGEAYANIREDGRYFFVNSEV